MQEILLLALEKIVKRYAQKLGTAYIIFRDDDEDIHVLPIFPMELDQSGESYRVAGNSVTEDVFKSVIIILGTMEKK